jgi:hypothetical protein
VAGALLLHDLRDPQVDQAAEAVVFWLILTAAWPAGAAIRRWSDRADLLAAEVAAREARARSEERAPIARTCMTSCRIASACSRQETDGGR